MPGCERPQRVLHSIHFARSLNSIDDCAFFCFDLLAGGFCCGSHLSFFLFCSARTEANNGICSRAHKSVDWNPLSVLQEQRIKSKLWLMQRGEVASSH